MNAEPVVRLALVCVECAAPLTGIRRKFCSQQCTAARWGKENADRLRASRLAYRARNAERITTRNREWRRANPDRANAAARRYAISRYGITADAHRNLLVGQAGRCAICVTVFRSDRDTNIDHDHTTGEVRGLLCSNCNTGIGMLGDSADRLRVAERYLRAGAV